MPGRGFFCGVFHEDLEEGKVCKGGQNLPEDMGERPEPPSGQRVDKEWDALKEKIGRLDGKSKRTCGVYWFARQPEKLEGLTVQFRPRPPLGE